MGKSTLVTLFSETRNVSSMALVNLERHLDLNSTFKSNNPHKILNILEMLPGIKAVTDDTLLFLDEIQAVPEAIPALRYFYEELPGQPLIAAGSLLEFVLSEHQFSMPVGRVEYLHLGPMTFTEFLDGIGENKLAEFIRTFQWPDTIESFVHNRLIELLS